MFDLDVAIQRLDDLERQTPPKQKPESIRAFIIANIDRINGLVARGWPVGEALQQIAEAANAKTSERTLIQYFRAAQKEQPTAKKKKVAPKASAAAETPAAYHGEKPAASPAQNFAQRLQL